MARIQNGYVEGKLKGRRYPKGKTIFLVKHKNDGHGFVDLGAHGVICFPQELIGKRIRLKVEVVEDA